MTREEAIQWLKVINTKKFGWDEFALQESQREIRERCEQGVREAIDMAIEALSADAEQVTGKLNNPCGSSVTDDSAECKEQKSKLESADAVHGEWVRKEKEYNDCDGHRAYYWYECSVCGARPPKNQWKNEWHSDYCPSCGANMKGGAE